MSQNEIADTFLLAAVFVFGFGLVYYATKFHFWLMEKLGL